ncbi:MAG: hypothetical protein KDC71_22495, partial [Acidobacteria bacterium]|nr:hypothetical protein [Acidobacteriota bacterium]
DCSRETTGWDSYLDTLRATGRFEGGSAIGDGQSFRKEGTPAALTLELDGFFRVRAANLAEVVVLLDGNPVYEAGGTVEIRELPQS